MNEANEHKPEQQSTTPDEFYFPQLNEKDKPLSTLGNLRALLKFYGIEVRYDTKAKQIFYNIPQSAYVPLYGRDEAPSQENELAVNKAAIKSLCIECGLPSSIVQYLIILADQG